MAVSLTGYHLVVNTRIFFKSMQPPEADSHGQSQEIAA